MQNDKKSYFTPRELADLAGISKQLLIYYDKNGIFSPAYITNNGYRYYSLTQYFDLEILVTMRKLEIPLYEIKQYLQNKNIRDLKRIYLNKIKDLQEKQRQLQKYEQNLNQRMETIRLIENIKLNQITLIESKEELYYLSPKISMQDCVKNRTKQMAKIILPYLNSNDLNYCAPGFLLDKNAFLHNRPIPYYRIFLSLNSACSVEESNILKKKPGLYLSINASCKFGSISDFIKKKLSKFIEINNLRPCSDIYVYPIRNYWSTSDRNEYFSRISLQVEYEE